MTNRSGRASASPAPVTPAGTDAGAGSVNDVQVTGSGDAGDVRLTSPETELAANEAASGAVPVEGQPVEDGQPVAENPEEDSDALAADESGEAGKVYAVYHGETGRPTVGRLLLPGRIRSEDRYFEKGQRVEVDAETREALEGLKGHKFEFVSGESE